MVRADLAISSLFFTNGWILLLRARLTFTGADGLTVVVPPLRWRYDKCVQRNQHRSQTIFVCDLRNQLIAIMLQKYNILKKYLKKRAALLLIGQLSPTYP